MRSDPTKYEEKLLSSDALSNEEFLTESANSVTPSPEIAVEQATATDGEGKKVWKIVLKVLSTIRRLQRIFQGKRVIYVPFVSDYLPEQLSILKQFVETVKRQEPIVDQPLEIDNFLVEYVEQVDDFKSYVDTIPEKPFDVEGGQAFVLVFGSPIWMRMPELVNLYNTTLDSHENLVKEALDHARQLSETGQRIETETRQAIKDLQKTVAELKASKSAEDRRYLAYLGAKGIITLIELLDPRLHNASKSVRTAEQETVKLEQYYETAQNTPRAEVIPSPLTTIAIEGSEHEGTYPRPHLKHPARELPTDGVRYYLPPKRKGNPEVVKTENGFLDFFGNIWVLDRSGHGGVHWDVQHPDGTHTNVYPDGSVRGADNFPNVQP